MAIFQNFAMLNNILEMSLFDSMRIPSKRLNQLIIILLIVISAVFAGMLFGLEISWGFLFIVLSLFILVSIQILKNPLLGFAVLAFTIPFDSRGISTQIITISISNVILISTIFSVIVHALSDNERDWKFQKWIPVIAGFYVISAFIAPLMTGQRISYVMTIIGCVAIYFIAITVITSSNKLFVIANVYLASALLQAIIGIGEFSLFHLTGFKIGIEDAWLAGTYVPRALGTHLDPNYHALFMIPALAYALSIVIFSAKRLLRFTMLCISMVIAFGILTSFSRTGWIVAVFAVAFLLLIGTASKWRMLNKEIFRLFLVILVLGFALTIIVLPLINIQFIRSLVELNERSVLLRFSTYEEAVRLFRTSPLIGFGDTNLTRYFVHSTFLYIALRAGLFGLLPFLVMVGYSVIGGISQIAGRGENFSFRYHPGIVAFVVGAASFLIGSMIFGIEGHKMTWYVWGISAAIVLNAQKLWDKNNLDHEIKYS